LRLDGNGWFLAAGALLAAAFSVHLFSGNRLYSAARPDAATAPPRACEAWMMGRCGMQMISVDLLLAAGFLVLSGLGVLPRSFWFELFLLLLFGGWGIRWLVSQVGVPGVWMILLITAVCFFIYISARTIIWLRKLFALSFLKRQKKEEEKETAEEGTQEFTTSQPQEVEFNLKRTYKQTPPPAPVMDIQAEEPKEESPVNAPEPDDELPSADDATMQVRAILVQ
jgi:hypothetical protein